MKRFPRLLSLFLLSAVLIQIPVFEIVSEAAPAPGKKIVQKKKSAKKIRTKKKSRRFYRVDTFGWISIRDYSKKRIYLLKNGQHLEAQLFSGAMKDPVKSLVLVAGNGDGGDLLVYSSPGLKFKADFYSVLESGGSRLLVFKEKKGLRFLYNGTLYGPYDRVDRFFQDPDSDSWAVLAWKGPAEYIVINGQEHKPGGSVSQVRFIRGVPFYFCITEEGTVIYSDGKKILSCQKFKEDSLVFDSSGGLAFIYRQPEGEYIHINGKPLGPYTLVGSLKYHDTAGFAYIYENSGGAFVNLNGTETGPYDSADNLAAAGGSPGWIFRYKKDGRFYLNTGTESSGPYDYIDYSVFQGESSPLIFSGVERGEPFVYCKGEKYSAPGPPVKLFSSGGGCGYICNDRGRYQVYFNGKKTGDFQEIGPLRFSDTDGGPFFYAGQGREGFIVTAEKTISLRIGAAPDSAGLALDGITPVYSEKSTGGTFVNIGDSRLGPYESVNLENSMIRSENYWVFSFKRKSFNYLNSSGQEIKLFSCTGTPYPSAPLTVEGDDLWHAQTVSDDGFFIIINGSTYGPDAVHVKNSSREKTLYWITIEGRSVYLNKKKY